jgi:uncharacterized protein YdeI (YjbR/CyaY-like superfamily)
MDNHDPRVDAYIAKSGAFARPILERIRAIVHEAVPGIEETIKWGAPNFVHAGGIVCMMAAFKQHVGFGFWKRALLFGDVRGGDPGREGMGSFGKLRSVAELPPKKELLALVRKAAALNEAGTSAPRPRKPAAPKPPPAVPEDLAAALKRNKPAAKHFAAFPPGQQREYVDWLAGARRDETRQRRLAQALEWIAEGKTRNWKYM